MYTDPTGHNFVLLNNSDKVSNHGHNGAIFGNDTSGWVYYSRDGKTDEVKGKDGRTPNGIMIQEFASLNDFQESDKADGYDRLLEIETSNEADEKMKETARDLAKKDTPYNVLTNSCANDVNKVAASSGEIKTKEGKMKLDNTRPNSQYEYMKEENSEDIRSEEIINEE